MRASSLASGSVALVIACVGIGGLVVIPLVKLAQVTFEDGDGSVARVMRAPGLGDAALHSVLVAIVVAALAVPIGTGMALFLRRPELPCRGLLRAAVLVPLIVPQFVLGYSWTQAYGRAGFTDSLLGVHWNALFGPIGVTVVLLVDAIPICFLLTSVGLATRAQPELEAAAHMAGASRSLALRTVTLPLLRPVLAAEAVLTFIAALESFAVPEVLGTPGGFSTLTVRIYTDLALASAPAAFTDAATLSLGLVLLAVIVLLPADLFLGPKLRVARLAHPGGIDTATRIGWRAAIPAALIACYVVLGVGLPTLALVLASITKAVGRPSTPANWTFANFSTAIDAPTLDAIRNSVELAGLAAFILTGLGLLICVVERRRMGHPLATVATLTFALPGTGLAVALLIAYGRSLGDGLVLILIAYLAKFWALAHRSLAGAVDRVPAAEVHAARLSGAGPTVAGATIWLPSLAPALLGAWALVFITALHEVTMSSLLYSVGNQTLAVAVLNSQQLGDIGATAALCLVLTALVALAALPLWLSVRLIGVAKWTADAH